MPIIAVDTSSLDKVAIAFRAAAAAKTAETRKALTEALVPVVADAKQRVDPFSSKSGDTIRVLPGEGDTVVLQTGNDEVPLAALLERGNADRPSSQPGTFRHPVWGGPKWAPQKKHPYLLPALNARQRVTGAATAEYLKVKLEEKLPHD